VPGVTARFLDAGHILGSAAVVLDVEEGGERRRFCFTGDVGRPNTPIIRDPEALEGVEYLVTESTYGNRLHDPIGDAETHLADAVNETASRGGKVIIPAFSVGRTQELVYALARLRAENRIPALRVFVDSPLSTNVTGVFRAHPECFDKETNALLSEHDDPFGFSKLTYTRSVEESKQINFLREPCVVLSASGMCETGRILHHLSNNIRDAKNTVLIVGFQAEHTLGRRLVEKQPVVRIFGEEHRVRAQVRVINAFSAHADRDELLQYIGTTQSTLRKVFVVHGEESQSLAFADTLLSRGIQEVAVPAPGETHTL
jgi:metallo-beta-lactamase family protein